MGYPWQDWAHCFHPLEYEDQPKGVLSNWHTWQDYKQPSMPTKETAWFSFHFSQWNKTVIQEYIGLTGGTKMKIVSNTIRPNMYVSILEWKLPKQISVCMCLHYKNEKCKVHPSLVIIENWRREITHDEKIKKVISYS